MVSFFHTYDLRGLHGEEIGKEEAEKVGKAFGTWTDAEEVMVARDGRKHSPGIAEAFIDGVKSTGTNVADAGMVPSPVAYHGMIEGDIEAATVVTASHNPPEYTGFKFAVGDALAVSREGGMREIEEIYNSEDFEKGEGRERKVQIEESYIEFVKSEIKLERGLEVAVNFGNGVTADIGREMLEELGCAVKGVNEDIDGSFPHHLPDPGNDDAKKALKEEMTGEEDLGIIFDGDGDRAGFILPGHGFIEEDEVLVLFSEESLKKEKGKVAHDLRASKLVGEKIRGNGGEPFETRVGHTFISEHIHEDPEIVFAGELSGHYYFPAFDAPFDDGLFAAALMCRIVSERDIAEELENFPDYPVSPELRIDCPEESKEKVVEGFYQEFSDRPTSDKDGVKVEFENGWALVRPSSTEPKMSVRCEADTEEDLDRILEEVESAVRRLIEEKS